MQSVKNMKNTMEGFMEISIFSTVLNMSIVGSIIVVIICLLRLSFKKIPKKIFLFFWLIAFFRLICPLSFQTPFSVVPLYISSGDCVIEWMEYDSDSAVLPDDAPELNTSYILVEDGLYEVFIRHNDWVIILCRIWYIILCLLSMITLVGYALLRNHLKNYTELTDKIFETQNYFIRPYHRIMKTIAFAVLLLHWFNPLVWIAFALFHLDLQMYFDEAFIKKSGMNKAKNYALSLSEFSSELLLFQKCQYIWDVHIEKRIENILNSQDSNRIQKQISNVFLCFGFVMMCASNQISTANEENLLAFLSDASYIEVELLSNIRKKDILLLHKETDSVLFQKIIDTFDNNKYTKSDLKAGKESQHSQYTFYDEEQRNIGEIIIYSETIIQIKHKLYSPETTIDIIVY